MDAKDLIGRKIMSLFLPVIKTTKNESVAAIYSLILFFFPFIHLRDARSLFVCLFVCLFLKNTKRLLV